MLSSAALSIVVLQAAAMARALRGCWPGPGSPPCDKGYDRSGYVMTTPAPGLPQRFPNQPSCMCPMPFPPGSHRRRRSAQAPAPAPAASPAPALTRGEVEVLTVDVRLANKVRCNNASIAKDVAKLLNIPVQRITVTPWSWAMDVPQENYLAFVQEDHERCDCNADPSGGGKVDTYKWRWQSMSHTSGGGKVMRGQGFRKVTKETDGAAIEPDTNVMTVSQYNAIHAIAQKKSLADAAASGPQPSRIQMLTRDPCLVHLLRTKTTYFRKRLAFLLGLPEDKVIIEPPPVKGTVGLLQVSTRMHTESEAHQVPFLAVHSCNAVQAAQREEHLHSSLLSYNNVPSPAPATLTSAEDYDASPAPAALTWGRLRATSNPATALSAENYDVASTGKSHVSLVMRLSNIDYDMVASNLTLLSSVSAVAKSAIGMSGHIPENAIKVAIFPGSTLTIEATITPPSKTEAAAIIAFLDGTVCNQTGTSFNTLADLTPATVGTIDCSVLSLSSKDSPLPSDESNRAWIAAWSVAILPPFAEEGAWRLLNLANKDMSNVSKLLPMTLARVPGLKYRSLKEPNTDIEARLPPPDDRAVGISLPDLAGVEALKQGALKVDAKRMKREHAAAELRLERKAELELKRAQAELAAAQQITQAIAQTDAKVTNAAKVHAEILVPDEDASAPDIMPPEVLVGPDNDEESPYHSFEDEPLGLVQRSPTRLKR